MLIMGRRRCRSPQRATAPLPQPPAPQQEDIRGWRGGAGIRHHHHGVRSKAFPGGRPSAWEAPQGVPLAEDPWSSGEPLATALPHRRRPGFRSPSMAAECGARQGPCLAI